MKARRNFDEVAAGWDENPGRMKVMGAISELVFERIPPASDMDVLDFGCGTGLLSLCVADQFHSLTGMDTSAEMLNVFSRKADDLGFDHVQTLLADLDQGGAPQGAYDLIVSSMVFHHIEHVPDVLKKLLGLLKPAGVLVAVDLDLEGGRFHSDPTGVFHEGFDRVWFAQMMKDAGFAGVRVENATEILRPEGERFTTFLASGRRS
ncbi:MAG: methyltransferase domain-containing protein [Pontiellaceae bacterium]|nr:methyltransferase domain-containing protein [Pontiellaceae bacterium]MBN2783865.1 methyltransferase domain-containing protein [Pontiellaceae bacterium]